MVIGSKGRTEDTGSHRGKDLIVCRGSRVADRVTSLAVNAFLRQLLQPFRELLKPGARTELD